MPANPPSRSVATVSLTFGMVTLPLKMYTGTEDTTVQRHEYTVDGRKVGRAMVVLGETPVEFVSREDVIYGVDTEHGLVELTDEELKSFDFGIENKTGTVVGFIPLDALGRNYTPEAMYQVRPEKPAFNRPFMLLLKALRKTGTFALVELVVRNRPMWGALLGNGRFYRLMCDEEVRADLPLPEIDLSDDDMRMMQTLVETMKTVPPVLDDKYQAAVEARLAEHVEKRNFIGTPIERPVIAPTSPDDLMAKLTASVEEARRAREGATT